MTGLKEDGGRAKGEGGRAKVEGGRAGGRKGGGKGWKSIGGGGKFENVKNLAAPPPSMRLWCDPQLGDGGKFSDINMKRIF